MPETHQYSDFKKELNHVGLNGFMFHRLGRIVSILFAGCFKESLLWIYLILILASIIYQIIVYFIGIYIPEFYTVLGAKDLAGFRNLVLILLGLVFSAAVIKSIISLCSGYFTLLTRRKLVRYIQERYILSGTLHHIVYSQSDEIDNPDQRITQDVDKLSESMSYILEKVVISPVLAIYYTVQIVSTDGWLAPVSLLAFFLISCTITRLVIQPIAKLIFVKEKKEGDFRYLHVRVTENAESIALLKGEDRERMLLDEKLHDLLKYQANIVNWEMLMAFIIGSVDYLGTIVSYVVVAIPIFTGKIDNPDPAAIGKNLFVSFYLLNVFTTIVDLGDRFADLAGYVARIGQLINALEEHVVEAPLMSTYHDEPLKNTIQVQDLSFGPSPEATKPIVQHLSFEATPGRHTIISGRSGSGKSTFFKLLAGLWSPLSGRMEIPSNVYFLPQLPYMVCGGTLREQVTYPDSPNAISMEELKEILEEVELGYLKAKSPLERDDLQSTQSGDWTSCLSSGEVQRIALARVLWRRPLFVFMDEGTVHLNRDLETRILTRAVDRGITFVAISHASLEVLKGAQRICLDQFSIDA